MKVSMEHVYTSIACNRNPGVVDWNIKNHLICFGATNAVVIYNTDIKHLDSLIVLSHHTSKVNCVKWLNNDIETELLSCSADNTAAIWSFDGKVWKVSSSLIGHENSVNCIHGLYIGDDLVVYTASVDSTIRIWERVDGITTLKQVINLNSGLCLTLHSALITSENKPILFCALDDHKIHVFTKIEEYHRVHVLVGHEDWVRGLDVLKIDNEKLMLASASQDTYIRLWRIHRHIEEVSSDIKVEEKVFHSYGVQWSVNLDAVLAGHEGWVYGVQWQVKKESNDHPVNRILSASLDKTLIVWEQESLGGAWVEKVRVGDVGGNGLGFFGGRFGPNSILGHGYRGTFHIWEEDKVNNKWQPCLAVGGHFGGVVDVRWEQQGQFLVSAGLDQTTRVHGPWRRDDTISYHELSRPQVHGYDMAALALVGPTTLISAADEKVIRVFKVPNLFVEIYDKVAGRPLMHGDKAMGWVNAVDKDAAERSGAASVPSLGLANKVDDGAEGAESAEWLEDRPPPEGVDGSDYIKRPESTSPPPNEETLIQKTLWPEKHKLYAHGYELHALDASPDGQLLASACRASTAEHAAPVLWEVKTWQQIQKLTSHNLTVTQLAFSPDSQRLLSVSRDRRWTLFKRLPNSNKFNIEAHTDKTNGVHTRIIWTCAWSGDAQVFATGSREGKVCVWARRGAEQGAGPRNGSSLKDYGVMGQPLDVSQESVTAVAFVPHRVNPYTLAVGFESGCIRIYDFNGSWSLLTHLDNSAAHHLTVKRLTFKPQVDVEQKTHLASCGLDNFVRIYALRL